MTNPTVEDFVEWASQTREVYVSKHTESTTSKVYAYLDGTIMVTITDENPERYVYMGDNISHALEKYDSLPGYHHD